MRMPFALLLSIVFMPPMVAANDPQDSTVKAPYSTPQNVSPQREFNRGFASPELEFLTETVDGPPKAGSSPRWVKWILSGPFSKEPASHPKDFRPGCWPRDLQLKLQATSKTIEQAKAIEEHFERCRDQVETGVNGRIRNSIEGLRFRFDYLDHPFIQRVMLNLPGPTKLRGLLALKGDLQKRPFVVLRTGVFSNVDEFLAERFLLMQLFEQGPFNVLVLENVTSAEFIDNNEGIQMGGPIEGFQNLQVAKLLRDPTQPLSKLVSSIHFVGISLGGNGLFNAAALDSEQKRGPWIRSFTNFCPVVHLRNTYENQIENSAFGFLSDWWVSLRLAGLSQRYPELVSTNWSPWAKDSPPFLRQVLTLVEKNYSPSVSEGLVVPKDWPKDLWQASEPWTWFKKSKAPVLLFATRDDDLVPVKLNAQPYGEMTKATSGNTSVVTFERGYHCTLAAAYDWGTIAAMMNGSILGSVPEWQPKPSSLDVDLVGVAQVSVQSPPKLDFKVSWPDLGNYAVLDIELKTDVGSKFLTVHFPFSSFDFKIRENPLRESVKRTLERWLDQNLHLEIKDAKTLRLSW